ncbi:hypothetical protein V1477_019646 [Vespula maculifrons]|uniref:Uncharacterized protein n=1 Tax=Vespula maculifrons TaxID=7453 RepID=A0ABD2AT25_VESMC
MYNVFCILPPSYRFYRYNPSRIFPPHTCPLFSIEKDIRSVQIWYICTYIKQTFVKKTVSDFLTGKLFGRKRISFDLDYYEIEKKREGICYSGRKERNEEEEEEDDDYDQNNNDDDDDDDEDMALAV